MKTLTILVALAAAQATPGQLETQAKNTIQPLIKITVNWIFPAVALMAALYGVARGVKRGEWDFAVLCLMAAIALAMIPTVVTNLFGMKA
jgi:hypothetical protein